jgi:hypothetical protein
MKLHTIVTLLSGMRWHSGAVAIPNNKGHRFQVEQGALSDLRPKKELSPRNNHEVCVMLIVLSTEYTCSAYRILGCALEDGFSFNELPCRGWGSIPGGGNDEIFSLRHRIQISSGAHPAAYPMGTMGKATGA